MTNFTLARLLSAVLCVAAATSSQAQTLQGFALLPADTYAPGPTSGQFVTGNNKRPHAAVHRASSRSRACHRCYVSARTDDFWVMPDNGFGAQDNSADYLLRLYRVQPQFKTSQVERTSTIERGKKFISLRDPGYTGSPFQIVADPRELYPR